MTPSEDGASVALARSEPLSDEPVQKRSIRELTLRSVKRTHEMFAGMHTSRPPLHESSAKLKMAIKVRAARPRPTSQSRPTRPNPRLTRPPSIHPRDPSFAPFRSATTTRRFETWRPLRFPRGPSARHPRPLMTPRPPRPRPRPRLRRPATATRTSRAWRSRGGEEGQGERRRATHRRHRRRRDEALFAIERE